MQQPSKQDWDELLDAARPILEVADDHYDSDWERLKIRMLGMSPRFRYDALRAYLCLDDNIETAKTLFPKSWTTLIAQRQIRAFNYISNLRRGGVIP